MEALEASVIAHLQAGRSDQGLQQLKPLLAEPSLRQRGWLLAANAYMQKGQVAAALTVLENLPQPEIEAQIFLLRLYTAMARYRDGLHLAEKVLTQSRTQPAEFYKEYAFLLARLRRHDEAVEIFRLLCQQREDSHTRSLLALSELALGDFQNGWHDYEARWGTMVMPQLPRPRWQGEALVGKTLLLWSEQGLGDAIQFARYLPLVRERTGARLLLAVPMPLLRLMKNSFAGSVKAATSADIEVIGWQTDQAVVPEFDFHCPLMSLPLLLQGEIPATTPYLFANPYEVLIWRYRFHALLNASAQHYGEADRAAVGGTPTAPGQRKKVGLVWAGSADIEPHGVRNYRSLPLSALEPLAAVTGLDFFSLQIGPATQSLEVARGALITPPKVVGQGFVEGLREPWQLWAGPVIHDVSGYIADFADTAAAISNLDLVISCDTATVHLAAALGKPTWLLNRYSGCWRWLPGQGRVDSPWYPNLRLFTQPLPFDWPTVIEEVVVALQHFAEGD